MPVDQNTLWLWKDIGMQELFDDLFFVKEKEHNFQKNKIIALLYLELREREENKPSNLSEKNLNRYLVVYFLCCLNTCEQK